MSGSTQFKLVLGTAAITASLLFAACGKASTEPQPTVTTATEDVTITPSATTVAALFTEPLSFPAGVADLGTTAPTTLAIAASGTSADTNSFTVISDGDTATGIVTYRDTVLARTAASQATNKRLARFVTLAVKLSNTPNPNRSPIFVVNAIKNSIMSVVAETKGKSVEDTTVATVVTFGATQVTVVLQVSISATGEVKVKDVVVGTTPIKTTPVTGVTN